MAEEIHGWFLISTCISVILTAVTYEISTLTTELKSRKGSILRGYLASVIGFMFLLTTLSLETILFGGIPVNFLSIGVISGIWYFWIASLFWLNSMCLDISVKFRKFRYSMDADFDERRRLKFSDYAIYAWGLAAVHTLLMIMVIVIWHSNPAAMRLLCFSVIFSPAISPTIYNIYLLVSTALIIRKYEKEEAAHMVQCVDISHKHNKEWFMSCVKLFTMTGMITVLIIVALSCTDLTCDTFISALTLAQGVSIFMIFVGASAMVRILLITMFLPIVGVLMSTVFLLILTVLIIKKRETEDGEYIACDEDVDHQENIEWFSSYVTISASRGFHYTIKKWRFLLAPYLQLFKVFPASAYLQKKHGIDDYD